MHSPVNGEYERLKHNLKIYHRYLNQCIRTAKKEFGHKEFTNYKSDIRKAWDTLKEIMNKKKTFNWIFHQFSFMMGLRKHVLKLWYIQRVLHWNRTEVSQINWHRKQNSFQFLSYKPLVRPHSTSLTEIRMTSKKVFEISGINQAQVNCDNISTKLLKEIEHIISSLLSIITNQSLCTGVFADKFKIANAIPVYKEGDDKSFGHYRPISLLSSISKIFERVAFNQLYDYLTSNDLLYESQYGFRTHTKLVAL